MPVPKIVSILKPSIEKDEIVLIDRTKPQYSDLQDSLSAQREDEKTMGSHYPRVSIRTVVIEYDEFRNFEISCENFLPEINLTVIDTRNRLTNVDFPLDGDIISVYLRPNSDDIQKSIRLDFEIVDVRRSGVTTVYYDFYGVLRIPTIYDEVCQMKEGTSFETLMSICSDLKLGFASNEDSTNDSQKWIVAKENREKFIKDITDYSYKDDNSFFTSFVDLFYHLNFINVQNCFSSEDQFDEAIITLDENSDLLKGSGSVSKSGEFYLTNAKKANGTNFMISNYAPFNNSGSIVRTNGYRRTAQFYDSDNLEFVDNFVEPLITNGSNDKVLLRGRKDEQFFKTLHKFKYFGKQNNNTHLNYLFARLLNFQNKEEISKTGLTITLTSLNVDIFRYRRIPVIIYDRNSSEAKDANKNRDEVVGDETTNDANTYDEEIEVKNEFLSGYYVVESFTIKFGADKFKMDIKLIRREWNDRGAAIGAAQDSI